MANKKITELDELLTALDADLLPIVDVANNETKKITVENLLAAALTNPMTADLDMDEFNIVDVGTINDIDPDEWLVNPLTANLDLGGNDINNVATITDTNSSVLSINVSSRTLADTSGNEYINYSGSTYILEINDGTYTAVLGWAGTAAAAFSDGTRGVEIANWAFAIEAWDGTYDANLCDSSNSAAGYFNDGSYTTLLCDGTYGLNTDGSINVGGTGTFSSDGITIGSTTLTETDLIALLALL
jgi:hypothetical protein